MAVYKGGTLVDDCNGVITLVIIRHLGRSANSLCLHAKFKGLTSRPVLLSSAVVASTADLHHGV